MSEGKPAGQLPAAAICRGSPVVCFATYTERVKISEKIKRLLRREPPTDEELEARAEAAALRGKTRSDAGEAELLTRRPG